MPETKEKKVTANTLDSRNRHNNPGEDFKLSGTDPFKNAGSASDQCIL